MQPDGFDQLHTDGVEGGQRTHWLLEHEADFAAADLPHGGAI